MIREIILGVLFILGGQYNPAGPVFSHTGGGGGGTPTLVQTPVFGAGTTTNTTVTFGTRTISGSTLVGQCQTTQFGGCVVTDDAGNTYTNVCKNTDNLWACTSYSRGAASATTMTFTFIFCNFQVGAYEVSGVTAVDVDPAVAQSGQTFDDYTSQTVFFTTTHASELLFCNGLQYGPSLALSGDTWTVGTAGIGSTNQGGMLATATQATAGAGACTMTFTDVGQRSAQLVLGLR